MATSLRPDFCDFRISPKDDYAIVAEAILLEAHADNGILRLNRMT